MQTEPELKEDLQDDPELEESRVYEISFWIAPTVPEENLAAEVQKIKDLLISHQAKFISEEAPKMRDIAYEFPVITAGRRYKFDRGYFGWMKMYLEPAAAPEIKKELQRNDAIIRSLIIKTVKENTMYSKRTMVARSDAKPTEGEVVKEPLSEEIIDKEIEGLVIK